MFKHVFDEMNKMLDGIIKAYPSAQGEQRQELLLRWNVLRQMSDDIIDEWLSFEEKMSRLNALQTPSSELTAMPPETREDAFIKGQGYYQLLMYTQSIEQFDKVLQRYPDSSLARIYKAMAHLQLEELDESWIQLNLLLPLTDHSLLQAIIYNALGCIMAKRGQLERAQQHFMQAIQCDSSLTEPMSNLEACRSRGQLQNGNQLLAML
ncbi:hypothetical protein Q5741_01225 [Paenibacillus sp. JX-17]|uniref:Tetratricopeptide repeat protein n=2 Tax=Paenibacillus lacisoli TaxID=3064525 RepID=A0ABT9C6Z9_9BACL|nr:hypothetical protein [Paenibacillus sp. JX-17]MDO7905031.1 hypothetical protein [Paenibacillus sp. JX-17]